MVDHLSRAGACLGWRLPALTIVAAIGSAAYADSADGDLSRAAHTAIQDLRRFYETNNYKEYSDRDRIAEFNRLLRVVAKQLDEKTVQRCALREDYDFVAKLAVIAWDREQNEELYMELFEAYRVPLNGRSGASRSGPDGVIHSPVVEARHATERFRSAWEYYYIWPAALNQTTNTPHSGIGGSTVGTVPIYRSEKSASLFVELYERGVRAAVRDPDRLEDSAEAFNYYALRRLESLPAPRSHQEVLRCLAYQSQIWGDSNAKIAKTAAETYLMHKLTGREKAEWEKSIETYPKELMTPAIQEVIAKARKLAAAPKKPK